MTSMLATLCAFRQARPAGPLARGLRQLRRFGTRDPYAETPESSFRFGEPETPPESTQSHHGINYQVGPADQLGLVEASMSMQDYFAGDSHHSHKIFVGQHQNPRAGQKVEKRTFVDLQLVRLRSGSGGSGAVSFFRDANRPVGPPDGGDGGDGGDIYISVTPGSTSLHTLKRAYIAGNGKSGLGSQLDGKRGQDVVIEVPVGTVVRWIPDPVAVRREMGEKSVSEIRLGVKMAPSNALQLFRSDYRPGEGWLFKEKDEEWHQERQYFLDLNEQVKDYDRETIASELLSDRFPLAGLDFSKPTKKPVLLVRGGKGGMGNMHFLTGDIRNPRFSKKGRNGLEEFFMFELKLIADLGLVGLPNAGKSTLLRAISRATPRVGHWEFTTLQPTVGTIAPHIDEDPFTVADIPGLIEGALQNRGMGMDFLRHIERCGGLVFVVLLESHDPARDLHVLISEVGPARMKGKSVLVLATKADLTTNGNSYARLAKYVQERDPSWRHMPVCAPRKENVDAAIEMMAGLARELRLRKKAEQAAQAELQAEPEIWETMA